MNQNFMTGFIVHRIYSLMAGIFIADFLFLHKHSVHKKERK